MSKISAIFENAEKDIFHVVNDEREYPLERGQIIANKNAIIRSHRNGIDRTAVNLVDERIKIGFHLRNLQKFINKFGNADSVILPNNVHRKTVIVKDSLTARNGFPIFILFAIADCPPMVILVGFITLRLGDSLIYISLALNTLFVKADNDIFIKVKILVLVILRNRKHFLTELHHAELSDIPLLGAEKTRAKAFGNHDKRTFTTSIEIGGIGMFSEFLLGKIFNDVTNTALLYREDRDRTVTPRLQEQRASNTGRETEKYHVVMRTLELIAILATGDKSKILVNVFRKNDAGILEVMADSVNIPMQMISP